MKLIDISIRERNPDYYDKSHDIETALAWNAIKKTLTEAERDDLFVYIKSVKVTEKYITIKTLKPLINAEIKIYGENIMILANTSLENIKKTKVKRLLRVQ